MSARATNLTIFALLLLEGASGLGSFLVGAPEGRWVFWLHSLGGFTLLVVLAWKWRIIRRSFRRRGSGVWALAPVLLLLVFLATLLTGLLWSTVGLPNVALPLYGRISGLTFHVLLALLLLPFVVIHLLARWPRTHPRDFASRRAALRSAAVFGAGLIAWQGVEFSSGLISLPGARRRFTGSVEQDSFQGNAHRTTNWLSDSRQHIDPAAWRLRVHGDVAAELSLTYDDLAVAKQARAILDCTGGWFTEQDWSGLSVADLLRRAQPGPEARSLVFQSATGYDRRFPLSHADRLLLATHVGGEALSASHGFPLRLVAPGRRGYHWVKWVTSMEVSDRPAWWQPPLPLQ